MLISTTGLAQRKQRGFFSLPGFPLIFLLLLWVLLLGWPTMAGSAEAQPKPAVSSPFLSRPADFDDCVKLALRQSPFFFKSSLEIEVRRLDEADSKSDFLPSLFFSSRYYLVRPRDPFATNQRDYYLAMSTGKYNPLTAYLSLKAKKVITKISILGHMKAISLGLKRLGEAFLKLDAAERLAQLQRNSHDLAKESLLYARERQKLGEIISLEVQIASLEEAVKQAERETVAASQAQTREAIQQFLGLEPDQPLSLDLHQTRGQVLGGFDPAQASLEKVRERDFDVRIRQLAQELQSWKVTEAKMEFVPDFDFKLETPDPTSSNRNEGAYFSIMCRFPIFEGFKRARDIKRQRTKLRQVASEEGQTTTELTQEWRQAEENFRVAAAALKVAEAKAKLAEMKERQAETIYRAGGENFSVFLEARQDRVKAQKEAVQAALDHDLAVLELRYLSGDLVYKYVHEDRFQ